LPTWQVEIRLRPPSNPAQASLCSARSNSGMKVVSPRPQTKRGRTDMVAKPGVLAAITSRSAWPFDQG
jgi:hypothetical protein